MKITIDTEFKTRDELDAFIRSRVGDNQEANISHEIELSSEEAKKFLVDKNTKIYGVRVIIKG